jgi:hypothetical protein
MVLWYYYGIIMESSFRGFGALKGFVTGWALLYGIMVLLGYYGIISFIQRY